MKNYKILRVIKYSYQSLPLMMQIFFILFLNLTRVRA